MIAAYVAGKTDMAGPRVAIVTPYHSEPERWLRQCYESVRSQAHPCTHIFVADGSPHPVVDTFEAQHIRLSYGHNDSGNTPRAIGAMSAIGQSFDAIAFLDADCLYHQGHISALLEAQRATGASVASSYREICHLEDLQVLAEDHTETSAGCDTNVILFFRPTFRLLSEWAFIPPELSPIGDRVLWKRVLDAKFNRVQVPRASVVYREKNAYIYKTTNMPLPLGCRTDNSATLAAERAWELSGGLPIPWKFLRARPGHTFPQRPLPPNC